jgi:hypothetical protein
MSDRLALSNAIEDAGIERAKAERLASVIVDVIHDNVATRADLSAVRSELKLEIAKLQQSLTRRGIAGLIIGGSVLFGALHLWPPHFIG